MKRTRLVVILPVALALASCGGGGPAGNPSELWLAPTNGEMDVELIDHQPPDF
jgi:hypothetical protein